MNTIRTSDYLGNELAAVLVVSLSDPSEINNYEIIEGNGKLFTIGNDLYITNAALEGVVPGNVTVTFQNSAESLPSYTDIDSATADHDVLLLSDYIHSSRYAVTDASTFIGINAIFTGISNTNYGAAMQIGAATTLSGVTFANNTTTQRGGALYNYVSGSIINNAVFVNNSCSNYGGAILNSNVQGFTVSGSTFSGNNGGYGSAITNMFSTMTIQVSSDGKWNYFCDNTGSQAIRNHSVSGNSQSILNIGNAYFSGNDGAIANSGNSILNITGQLVLATTKDKIANGGTINVICSNFLDNNVLAAVVIALPGGTVSGMIPTLLNLVKDNVPYAITYRQTASGYYIMQEGVSLDTPIVSNWGNICRSVVDSSVYYGEAYSSLSKALSADNTIILDGYTYSSGRYVIDSASTINGVNGAIFSDNINSEPTISGGYGGALVISNEATTVSGLTFSQNSAAYRGGAFHNGAAGSIVDKVLFSGNSATGNSGYGGALTNAARGFTVSGSTFSGNYAKNGSAIANMFGTMSIGAAKDGTLTYFRGNTGAAAIINNAQSSSNPAILNISNTYFADNAGAIYNLAGGTVNMTGAVIFATNSDVISNSGILNIAGTNIFCASISGSGTFNVAENAVLTFNNTEEIGIAALTINTANSNTINLNGTVVNFSGLDVSKVTITVDGTGLEAGDVIATGVTGTIDDDTVANVEKGYLDIVEGNLVLKVKTDKAGVLEENSTGSVYGGGSETNDGTNITQTIASGLKQGTVFAGSEKGVDGKITTTVTGGEIAKHLYGGGKVSAESTELTVESGTVGKDVYGGLLIKETTNAISLGESNLTVSGGTFNQYVVGGSRVTAADVTTTHTAGKVTLTLAGGDFAFAGTNTDPGASIFGAGYVQGFNNTAAVNAPYQVTESDVTVATDITGAVYGGAFVSKSGLAQVDKANITVSAGSVDRVFGGGWAQTNGISNVGDVNILIENSAAVGTIYVGGGNDISGATNVTGTVTVTVTGSAAVGSIFMGGRYNNSLVSGNVTVTISGEAKTFDRISGDGSFLENTGTSSLVIDTTATVELLDGIDKLTITDGSTLNLTNADFSGLTEICFDLEDAVLDNADWTVMTGVSLNEFENAKFMIGNTEMTFADNVYTGGGFKVFEDKDGIKFATIA